MDNKEATYMIKAGTVVTINGIPLEVLRDTPAFTSLATIPLIDVPPPVGGWTAEGNGR